MSMSGRTLHYVVRSTDLAKGLRFYQDVFGMKVLRHEENAEPCPIACNGKYNSAWSKTMVGYDQHTEDKFYCLEVVYNYGVQSYPPPTGLRSIHIAPADAAAALAKAQEQGFSVEGSTISGPDGYKYVVEAREGREEPFRFVTLGVRDVAASRRWYTEVWGFEDMTAAFGGGESECYVGWAPESACGEGVPLRLVQAAGVTVDPQIDGRHAVAIPTTHLKERYAALEKEHGGNVVFPMRVLAEDKLGALYLAITKDPDGHELCTVSKETFDPAVANPPYNEPDYAFRAKFIEQGTASLVQDVAAPAGAGELKYVGEDDWDETVGGKKLTVAWFTADWCGPCKLAKPKVERLAGDFAGRDVQFIKINIDNAEDIVEEVEVTRPPTIQFWKEGRKLDAFEGADKLDEVAAALQQMLG